MTNATSKLSLSKLSYFILAVVLFGNLWVWRIFNYSILIGLLVVVTSIFVFLSTSLHPSFRRLAILFFVVMLVLQFHTSERISLIELSNDQIRERDMRLKEYPPVKLSIVGKTVWIPVAHWFENRKESIAFFRILDNISYVVDPNLYFFANHPRQRVGIKEFEKFPYILSPFFIIGLFHLFNSEKNRLFLLVSIILPVVLISFIGNMNSLGPFCLFPIMLVAIVNGLGWLYRLLVTVFREYCNLAFIVFWIFYTTNLIQIVLYEGI